MRIYKISRKEGEADYNEYKSAIVYAPSRAIASLIHPSGFHVNWLDPKEVSEWVANPEDVKVTYLGQAKKGAKSGIIDVNYNAG